MSKWILTCLLVFCLGIPTLAAPAALQVESSLAGYLDNSGKILANGTIAFYTSDAYSSYKTVYSDASKTTAVSQPISLNSSGIPVDGVGNPIAIFADGVYWMRLKSSTGTTIRSYKSVTYQGAIDFGGLYIDVASTYGRTDSALTNALAAYSGGSEITFLFNGGEFINSSVRSLPSNVKFLFVNGAYLTNSGALTAPNIWEFQSNSYISNSSTISFTNGANLIDTLGSTLQGSGAYTGNFRVPMFATNEVYIPGQYTSINLAIAAINKSTGVSWNIVLVGDSPLTATVSIPANVKKITSRSGYLTGVGQITFTGQYLDCPPNEHLFRGSVSVTGNIANSEVYPKWAGAIPDDLLEDTSYFTKIKRLNKPIKVNEGTFLLKNFEAIDGLKLSGVSKDKSILKITNDAVPGGRGFVPDCIMYIPTGSYNVSISDLYFDAIGTESIRSLSIEGNASKIEIQNCIFKNSQHNTAVSVDDVAIILTGHGSGFNIHHNFFENTDCCFMAQHGGASNVVFSNNIIKDCSSESFAIWDKTTPYEFSGAVVADNIIENTKADSAIAIKYAKNVTISGNRIKNVSNIVGTGSGIRLYEVSGVPAKTCNTITIVGNQIDTVTNTGIYLKGNNITCVGNNIKSSAIYGIDASVFESYNSSTTKTNISNNVIESSSSGIVATGELLTINNNTVSANVNGIALSGARNFSVSGNNIRVKQDGINISRQSSPAILYPEDGNISNNKIRFGSNGGAYGITVDSGHGTTIPTSNRITISNNVINSNGGNNGYGINVAVLNSNINGNTITDSKYGIYAYRPYNTLINNNSVQKVNYVYPYWGIYVDGDCNRYNVSFNNIKDYSYAGIWVDSDTQYGKVAENIIDVTGNYKLFTQHTDRVIFEKNYLYVDLVPTISVYATTNISNTSSLDEIDLRGTANINVLLDTNRFIGKRVVLKSTIGTSTLKHNVGNIYFMAGSDVVLNGRNRIELFWDGSYWVGKND